MFVWTQRIKQQTNDEAKNKVLMQMIQQKELKVL